MHFSSSIIKKNNLNTKINWFHIKTDGTFRPTFLPNDHITKLIYFITQHPDKVANLQTDTKTNIPFKEPNKSSTVNGSDSSTPIQTINRGSAVPSLTVSAKLVPNNGLNIPRIAFSSPPHTVWNLTAFRWRGGFFEFLPLGSLTFRVLSVAHTHARSRQRKKLIYGHYCNFVLRESDEWVRVRIKKTDSFCMSQDWGNFRWVWFRDRKKSLSLFVIFDFTLNTRVIVVGKYKLS